MLEMSGGGHEGRLVLGVFGIERSRDGDHDLAAGMPRLQIPQRLGRLELDYFRLEGRDGEDTLRSLPATRR
jgi:hypothetical protein